MLTLGGLTTFVKVPDRFKKIMTVALWTTWGLTLVVHIFGCVVVYPVYVQKLQEDKSQSEDARE